MEKNQIMMKDKLGLFGLQKEATKILYQNPKFVILTFLTSLPLFFCMLFHELLFQKTLIEAARFKSQRPETESSFIIVYAYDPLYELQQFGEEFSQAFLQLGFLYLVLIHLPDLLNTTVVVQSASVIYSGEKLQKVRQTLYRSFENGTFKRSLITSIYALLMASLVFIGLIALASQMFTFSFPWRSYGYHTFGLEAQLGQFGQQLWWTLMYGLPFLALLYKYLDWSSLWNLGIITSILEDKQGVVALGVSAYISRGNRRHGQVMAAIFFIWKISLRLMVTIYVGLYNDGDQRKAIVITSIQVFLVCLGNIFKWVIFMIFFYDCKKRFLEKKIDVEEGKRAASIEIDAVISATA